MGHASQPAAQRRGRRVAIVAGLRSPFVKAGTVFKDLHAVNLASQVVAELMARTGVDGAAVQRLVFGQVVGHPSIPNVAREVGMASGLAYTTDAYSVARACATSTQAIVEGAMSIACGEVDVVVAGGVEMLSRPPMTYQDRAVDALMAANASKSAVGKAKALLQLRPKDLLPVPPALKEPSTGLTMGEGAEKMAKENQIGRAEQDALALKSHTLAAKAWQDGIYRDEVMAISRPPKHEESVAQDPMVRADTSLTKLAALKPVFDRKHGSITAGNSSPLTDGAAAVMLVAEDHARALGLEPLAFVEAWGFAAVDPNEQLLAGPAIAIPRALKMANLTLNDLDVIDMHEAFAAQVLSNVKHLADAAWQRAHGNPDGAVGEVNMDRVNLYGGSISLGHPFAATGARQALTMAHELHRRKGGTALISQCTAGGLGACLILRR